MSKLRTDVKIVILAAGMSTRLKTAIPKALIPLKNEETVLDLQLKEISKYISLENVILVVGFKKELFMERYPDLTYVYNNSYAFTNTAKSLLKALKKINSDVIWMNGDVVFDAKILDRLLALDKTSMIVDTKRCGEEEVKYSLDEQGYIAGLSKELVDAGGEALGINMFKGDALKELIHQLELVDDKDYFEKAIENMIKNNHVKVLPVYAENLYCKEIDFLADLKEVVDHVVKNG